MQLILDHKKAVILEFNSETDFVAKNEEFKEFGRKLVKLALERKCSSIRRIKCKLKLKETKKFLKL